MDATTLATSVASVLAPALPLLVKTGEEAAKEAGKRLSVGAIEHARALWEKLRPRVDETPTAQAAARRTAEHPDDARARGALELELEDLLRSDPALAAELARILDSVKGSNVSAVASGDRSVAIGGNASQNTIVTGDQNRVGPARD